MTNATYYTTATTAVGELLLAGNEKGLRLVRLVEGELTACRQRFSLTDALRLDGFFDSTVKALSGYLDGHGPLALPYDLGHDGTPLQRMVWLALTKIPYGETISYTALAERVGFPRAVRAVASACGANPLPLVIPCHRVVAKDGTLGGFSLGGVDVKEKLLAIEGRKHRVAA